MHKDQGTPLINSLHEFASHGDPLVSAYMQKTISQTTQPILQMISEWSFHGHLSDPFNEFFVKTHQTKIERDTLWKGMYLYDLEKVPEFVNGEMGELIFKTGKTLNFISVCCGDGAFVKEFGERFSKGESLYLMLR